MTPHHNRQVDVIVAGAGHNGLVAAAYLAKAGLDVLVLEASPTLGGMTSTNAIFPDHPEYMVNEGSVQASLFRTTNIDRELQLGSKYGLQQRVGDPAHVQMQLDCASLALWRDPQKVAEELKHFSRKDAQAYLDIFEVINAATQVGLPLMQTNPVRPEFQAVMKTLGRASKHRKHLAEIARWAGSTQAETVEEHFESDIIKAALMIGLPFMNYHSDTSGWALIYLGVLSRYGVSMFLGGTGAFPRALAACIADNRGRIRTDAKVSELIVRSGRVVGVRIASGEEIYARRGVLTAFSPYQTLNRLLPKGVLPERLQNRVGHIPTQGRGFADGKLNVILKGKIKMTKMEKWRGDGLDLRVALNSYHTYEETLNAQYAAIRGEVPDHIPGLAYITSAFDPTLAPAGGDTFWFWTGLLPYDPKIGWEKARAQATKTIISQSEFYYEGLEELEIQHEALMPPDIEERFHAESGSVYHVDPVVTRFGPAKPAWGFGGYRTPVPGLFLTGSGTHPVAGISGMPGQNAAKTMIKLFKREDKKGVVKHALQEARVWETTHEPATEPVTSEYVARS
jgi:phytoene dehydrogenase-like protein